MIFDTDILIWAQRGNSRAAELIDSADRRHLSAQTYMEFLQQAPSLERQKLNKRYLADGDFNLLPLSEQVGHRAMAYVELYSLSHGLGAGDALIAATAVEHDLVLATGNAKHFKAIKGLRLKIFKP